MARLLASAERFSGSVALDGCPAEGFGQMKRDIGFRDSGTGVEEDWFIKQS